jgi:hypothetical protein
MLDAPLRFYLNHINDFHLADTIPNWLAVPAVAFVTTLLVLPTLIP